MVFNIQLLSRRKCSSRIYQQKLISGEPSITIDTMLVPVASLNITDFSILNFDFLQKVNDIFIYFILAVHRDRGVLYQYEKNT